MILKNSCGIWALAIGVAPSSRVTVDHGRKTDANSQSCQSFLRSTTGDCQSITVSCGERHTVPGPCRFQASAAGPAYSERDPRAILAQYPQALHR